MGSPTKRNKVNAISATTSITSRAWRARRRRNASIPSLRCGRAAKARRKSRTLAGFSASFLPEPIEQNRIVGALHDLDLFRHAPYQRLLVQRDVRDLLVDDAHGLGDHLVTFCQIGFAQYFAGQGFDLLAAIPAEIELTAVALLVATADDVVEHVPPVERAGRPAEQIK